MQSKFGLVLLVCCALCALVLTVAYAQRAGGGKEADSDEQWEYLVVAGGRVNLDGSGLDPRMRKLPDDSFGREAYALERNLDKLGAKGWQLVQVLATTPEPVFYFKRLKSATNQHRER